MRLIPRGESSDVPDRPGVSGPGLLRDYCGREATFRALLAQRIEPETSNLLVVGSIPAEGTSCSGCRTSRAINGYYSWIKGGEQ